jgi:hypothetical protein
MNECTFRLEFDDDDTLHLRGRDGRRHPICPKCDLPIRWVLDMASFAPDGAGGHVLLHARCAWTQEAFIDEGRRAPVIADAP